VQRYARELVTALDAALPAALAGRCELLRPPGASALPLARIAQRTVGPAGCPPWLWEQVVLPRAAREGWLLNLAGAAPARAGRSICTLHDAAVFDCPEAYTAAFGGWYRWLFRHLARRGVPLNTVSQFSRARLADVLHLSADSIGLVPDGGDHLYRVAADTAAPARLGLAPGRFLLAVGSRARHKNLPALAAAFARLKSEAPLTLAVVGGGNAGVFAPTADGARPTSSAVRELGVVDDATLKALYQQALALVFPSRYEGFGLPPLEALSCGCPVLVARAGALPEVCGEAALYFDPEVRGALEGALQQLVDDAALRARLATAGPARAAAWTWARSAEALLARVLPLLEARSGA
jgi:glycosyltransferase involved in cell wall biosynthesis